MSQDADPATPAVDPTRPATPPADREALAASAPDQNTILMRMIGLLTAQRARPVPGLELMNSTLAGIVIILFVVAQWGVPALLAGQTLILQLKQSETEQVVADREVQRQQVTATRDVLDAIGSIGAKLDTQSAKIDDQGRKIDAQGRRLDTLASDVADLQRGQAATSRGLASVQARQLRLESAAQK